MKGWSKLLDNARLPAELRLVINMAPDMRVRIKAANRLLGKGGTNEELNYSALNKNNSMLNWQKCLARKIDPAPRHRPGGTMTPRSSYIGARIT